MASKSNQRRAIAALACGHLAALLGAGCAAEPPLREPRSFPSQLGDGVALSPEATCSGAGRSPLLQWRAPAGGYVAGIVSSDGSSGRTLHWLFWDQPSDPGGLGVGVRPGQFPPGQGGNSADTIGWLAPCPHAGAGTEQTVTAELWWTPAPLEAPPTLTEEALRERLAAHAEGRSVATVSLAAP